MTGWGVSAGKVNGIEGGRPPHWRASRQWHEAPVRPAREAPNARGRGFRVPAPPPGTMARRLR